MRRLRPVAPLTTQDGLRTSVTAFVPARNESAVIAASIEGLEAQGGLLERVVAVDDGSTDGTGEVLAGLARRIPRLEVLAGKGPGPGECGKPAALRDAVASAAPSSEWLLFLDADVVLEPGALAALLDLAERRRVDLVSGFPRLVLGTILEQIVMPAVGALVVASNPPEEAQDPASPRAFANGQMILVRRIAYERAGGHAGVVREILEDVRFAENVKRAGGRLALVDARLLARTRMYESWSELREGWSKNLYLLVGARPAAALGWAMLSVALGWAGLAAFVVAGLPLGPVAYGSTVVMQAVLRAAGGTPWRWAVLAPMGSLIAAYLLLRSMHLHRGARRVAWKGRTYSQGG